MSNASTPIQYPYVNGSLFSFSSVEWKLAGLIFRGFKSIDFSRKRDRPKVWGNSPDPLGKVVGKNDYDAGGELYLAEFLAFVSKLGPGYGDQFFSCYVTVKQAGFGTAQWVINGCTLDEATASFAEGTDPLAMKFALNPLKILTVINGVTLDDLAIPLTSPPQ
jgi:hypothetical protein